MNKSVLALVLVVFSALSAYAVHHAGGVLELVLVLLRIPEGWQVMADLIIAMCLLLVFVRRDAKSTGRPFWPWAIFSLMFGSFGPLLYFITAKERP
jgi:drug/metabolite transporter (DMT)-like permease